MSTNPYIKGAELARDLQHLATKHNVVFLTATQTQTAISKPLFKPLFKTIFKSKFKAI